MADEDNTGLLGYLAGAVQVRAAGHRDKAATPNRAGQ